MPQSEKASRIILEDGTEFEGISFGYETSVAGEIVFYTGFPDIPHLLSDPALKGVILVIAQPEIGATGIPDEFPDSFGLDQNFESPAMQIAGLVIASIAQNTAQSGTKKTLARWLKKQQIPALTGIDTRALIQRISLRGTMRAKILVDGTKDVSFSFAGRNNQPLNVSIRHTTNYGSGSKKILLVDCGVKNSTIRSLVASDTAVIRVPCAYDFSADDFDGVCVCSGPGDPTSCEKTIQILRRVLKLRKPMFAVGQGAVILAIAAGASAFRMPHGHRGVSLPCLDLENGRCYITAQNHGYGIREDSLPDGWETLFLNNCDNTIEGFTAAKGLFRGVLFQPEGNPGPADTAFLYTQFLETVRKGGIRE